MKYWNFLLYLLLLARLYCYMAIIKHLLKKTAISINFYFILYIFYLILKVYVWEKRPCVTKDYANRESSQSILGFLLTVWKEMVTCILDSSLCSNIFDGYIYCRNEVILSRLLMFYKLLLKRSHSCFCSTLWIPLTVCCSELVLD